MANEISMQATLSVQRTGLAVQGSATKTVDQDNGSNSVAKLQSIASGTGGGVQVDFAGLTFTSGRGFLFVKNTDVTNYVELSVASTDGTTFNASAFAKLLPGEFCLIALNTSKNYYARANGAAVVLQVAVVAK